MLDSIDKDLLNRIQGDFPISVDHYGDIGRSLGISGEEALGRVRRLIETGVLRKVGPFFDARKMGYTSTLCAMDVPEAQLEAVAAIISAYPQVTHNYLRAGHPNLWFTVIAESRERIDEILSGISKKSSISPIHNLNAMKMFKVKVDLKVGE